MEEKKQGAVLDECCAKARKCNCICGAAPFVLGLVVALTFGWWVFPDLLFSKREDPFFFSHKVHVEDQGMACSDCHSLREDGSWSGIPRTEDCASCHADVVGETKDEAIFVRDYVQAGKEVKWQLHQTQPDNVFFSHAAHSLKVCGECHPDWTEEGKEKELCALCHPTVEQLDQKLANKVNVLSGYNQQTMKMWRCEECHANENHYGVTNSNNACYTCHK